MRSATPILSLAAIVALAGCANTPAAPAADGVAIVATTDVYGSIAQSIGGDAVSVTSIIEGATHDPHSYEANVQDQLAVSKAQLVISNGGGYDPFIETLLEASKTEAVVIVASEASGLLDGSAKDPHADEGHADVHAEDEHAEDEHAGEGDDATQEIPDKHNHIEGFNEHVWYDFHAVESIAAEIAHELSEIDPDNAATFEANLAEFSAELEGLEELATALRVESEGKGVAITEPVPTYLLTEVGLDNRTPEEFSEAIEEGTDVSPATLRDTLATLDSDSLAMLAYNSQTASPETQKLREEAESRGIPVVEFTETLPDGADYVSWMTGNLEAISAALEK